MYQPRVSNSTAPAMNSITALFVSKDGARRSGARTRKGDLGFD